MYCHIIRTCPKRPLYGPYISLDFPGFWSADVLCGVPYMMEHVWNPGGYLGRVKEVGVYYGCLRFGIIKLDDFNLGAPKFRIAIFGLWPSSRSLGINVVQKWCQMARIWTARGTSGNGRQRHIVGENKVQMARNWYCIDLTICRCYYTGTTCVS